ncbi:MAG: class I SAM-dependent methyltransferase [Chthoniobacterales bacterium]
MLTIMQFAIDALPSQGFVPLRYGMGAWTGNIYFAYDLIAQLRPPRLVELGTDRGESYFAFCQSVLENQTGTECFAIDHWQGDTHAGSYDETTFRDVEVHNRAHYASFSTLIRSTFDDARERFAAESIDFLHIDGHHTEEAARHDVEAWLPKLRPGGILLVHDVTMRGRDFGVWKVWDELSHRGRHWTFEEPPGLGVWEKPPGRDMPPLLEALFASPNDEQSRLLEHYRRLDAALQARVAQQWRDGTIRSAPMAVETVIQIFWTNDGHFSEEHSADVRIGHNGWKEVAVSLPPAAEVNGLRIDFYSALTTIEIETIEIETQDGEVVYRAEEAASFDAIGLLGDGVRRSLDPFRIEVTGVDPQLHLPPLGEARSGLTVKMRLRATL